jgi:ABC-type sugar transport system ATPase subunit
MGRAIVRQPQVFLFDEPLLTLDAKLLQTSRKFKTAPRTGHPPRCCSSRTTKSEAMTLLLTAGDEYRGGQFGTRKRVCRPATFVASFAGLAPMNHQNGPNAALGGRSGATLGDAAGTPRHHRDRLEVSVETIEMLGAERLVYAGV